ncbi:hypothetical protein PAMP_014614 [Pampus punctatissimus]
MWLLLFVCMSTVGGVPINTTDDATGSRPGGLLLNDTQNTTSPVSGVASVIDLPQQASAETLEELCEDMVVQEGDILIQEDRNAVMMLWMDAIVPYIIDDALGDRVSNIHAAFKMISDFTCIRFQKRTTEMNYLKFLNGRGCASFVGCQGGGQPVYYASSCSVGNLCHEIIHALGLHHEHTRKDRDQYITVQWNSIIPGSKKNFKMKHGDTLNLPYDLDSIMHYGKLHDGGPELLREVLLERGWEEYDEGQQEEEDWNLYWRGSAFRNSEYHSLLPWQRLNHHPKTVGITRKDCLARNLRRMRATFGSALYDFSPTAFILPNDFTRFLAEYNKLRLSSEQSVYWICKPVDLSRGRGIFIFENIKDLVYDCSVIVQRYISNPLLISGYKFDLRIYVCVKSFHPLTVYIHQEGLVRFSTEKYNLSSLQNLYAHLTNTSINKFGPFYKTEKERVGQGCKWTMSKFRHFLNSQGINELLLWQKINNIVTLTLLTIAPSVPSCPNCVELFGFDVLLDATFRPWLLEVNYSPALTLDCQADIAVKKGLIGDLIDLMNYTSIDSLRERAYQRQGYKPFCFHANQPTYISIPVLPNFKEPNSHKKRRKQTLPLLKTLRPPDKTSQRKSRQHAFVSGYQRHLPPVNLNNVYAARGRITATEPNVDKNLNLMLGPHSRTNMSVANRRTCPALTPCLMGNRSLHVSEVTNHRTDTKTETETQPSAETDVSSSIPDIPQRGLGFKTSAVSCKLPNIHRLVDGAMALNGQHIPPLRVGDFIRTFPFNTATLKASQHTLDVKMVIQELHKLTGQLAAGPSVKTRSEEQKVKDTDGEEELDSLLWGPKDPPLLSQCLKPV